MTHTRVIRTTARQDMIRIRDELKAELDTIYGSLPLENMEPVLEFNKQLNDIETELYNLRKKARTSSLTTEEDERFSELATKFAQVYWQRVPFLEDMEHELWMHRAVVEERLRQKEEYMIITDDDEMERDRAWETSPEFHRCPLLVEEIPGPTRYERGLEVLPCIFTNCPRHGVSCYQSTHDPHTMHLGVNMFGGETDE